MKEKKKKTPNDRDIKRPYERDSITQRRETERVRERGKKREKCTITKTLVEEKNNKPCQGKT